MQNESLLLRSHEHATESYPKPKESIAQHPTLRLKTVPMHFILSAIPRSFKTALQVFRSKLYMHF
jgi:hypothetical protein